MGSGQIERVKDFFRRLNRFGCEVVPGKGSHFRVFGPNGQIEAMARSHKKQYVPSVMVAKCRKRLLPDISDDEWDEA